ncbi:MULTISPECIES: sulfurtransferase TusA family protein [unclassified Haladaptatus]|uniref:sulfurtransferase TusA family protein n=1 Tax=unclassified Haladaptatus TaxID=2622732 RepID=UPI002FCE57BF
MTQELDVTETLDARGMNCPMPVMQTKQASDDLAETAILEVLATDPGSMSDIKGWANGAPGVELVTQHKDDSEEQTVYKHYIRKTE